MLIDNNCSSLADIKIIYNIIIGFPYCINKEGNYIYKGKLYLTLEDLPLEALNQIIG